MSLIVFSHANSFPDSTYGVLFKSLRALGHTVRALEKFGHDPKYPVTSNWPTSPGRRSRSTADRPGWSGTPWEGS